MPCVRSNGNAAARWIKSLFNNAHLLCQLLFTLILLTYTKEERRCRILLLESAADSFARACSGAYSDSAHGHTVFLSSERVRTGSHFALGILSIQWEAFSKVFFCWCSNGKLEWRAKLLHSVMLFALCSPKKKKKKKREKQKHALFQHPLYWPAWTPIITHCVRRPLLLLLRYCR